MTYPLRIPGQISGNNSDNKPYRLWLPNGSDVVIETNASGDIIDGASYSGTWSFPSFYLSTDTDEITIDASASFVGLLASTQIRNTVNSVQIVTVAEDNVTIQNDQNAVTSLFVYNDDTGTAAEADVKIGDSGAYLELFGYGSNKTGQWGSIFTYGNINQINASGTKDLLLSAGGEIYFGPGDAYGASLIVDNNVPRFILSDNSKTAIPTEGDGMFVIDGPNSSVDGPHQLFYTSADNYPLMQFLLYTHDNISIVFDGYYDSSGWQSGDSGSNYIITKNGDELAIKVDSSIAAGSTVTWGSLLTMRTDKQVIIGDNSANTNMNIGLHIDQGAQDGDILSFASSDIAHGCTTLADTDVYLRIKKGNATAGGGRVDGFNDTGAQGLNLYGNTVGSNTTTGTSAAGSITLYGQLISGTGVTTHGSTSNIFVVRNSGNAQLILKGNGQLYTQAGGGGPYDTEDDIALLKALNWYTHVDYHKNMLDSVYTDIVPRRYLEDLEIAIFEDNGGVWLNVQNNLKLLMGAGIQQRSVMKKHYQLLMDRIDSLEKQNKQLMERLERLEHALR